MATEKQIEKLFQWSMNPASGSFFRAVGKRGWDEILGPKYDYDSKSIDQIKKDLIRLGKSSLTKEYGSKKA